jgi:hypothetical protein
MPEAARLDAVRFLCGLPNAPGEWDEECTQDTALQRRVGRQVYGAVNKLVQRYAPQSLSAGLSSASGRRHVDLGGSTRTGSTAPVGNHQLVHTRPAGLEVPHFEQRAGAHAS